MLIANFKASSFDSLFILRLVSRDIRSSTPTWSMGGESEKEYEAADIETKLIKGFWF